jgi:hypothetical protein
MFPTNRRHSELFAANLPADVGSEDSRGVAVRLAPRLAFAFLSGRSVCGSKGAVTRIIVPDLHGSGAYCFALHADIAIFGAADYSNDYP